MFRFAVTWVYPGWAPAVNGIYINFSTDIPGNYVVRYVPGLLHRPTTYPPMRGKPWRKRDITYPKEWRAVKAELHPVWPWYTLDIAPWEKDAPLTFIVTAVPDPWDTPSQAGPFTYPYYLCWSYFGETHP